MSLHFVALGDSTTVGVGDPLGGKEVSRTGAGALPGQGWRGWAALLAEALNSSQTVTFTNLASSGATAPQVAAGRALLLTVRFHDHGLVFGLPAWLRRPLWRRLELVNAAYDDLYATYGGIRVDLAACPEVYSRQFWSIDRLHPGERGHRTLARVFADRLAGHGFPIAEPPSLECDAQSPPTPWGDAVWMLREGAPWVGRRARDLAPWAARMAVSEARTSLRKREPSAA